ncbi:hypothetical protein CFIO01_07754 [Colletotrichum fioriniae PJ7]|uniref:Uncharacterized protein n=1 Tax=Colletotrichum fioriniae PJ7 TaxID=1445577 RepID=A0A010RJN4_9PEZI|nr:hypothetical protein CFIO01_07754 [Colletotrichum fioriniae PJ7]
MQLRLGSSTARLTSRGTYWPPCASSGQVPSASSQVSKDPGAWPPPSPPPCPPSQNAPPFLKLPPRAHVEKERRKILFLPFHVSPAYECLAGTSHTTRHTDTADISLARSLTHAAPSFLTHTQTILIAGPQLDWNSRQGSRRAATPALTSSHLTSPHLTIPHTDTPIPCRAVPRLASLSIPYLTSVRLMLHAHRHSHQGRI